MLSAILRAVDFPFSLDAAKNNEKIGELFEFLKTLGSFETPAKILFSLFVMYLFILSKSVFFFISGPVFDVKFNKLIC